MDEELSKRGEIDSVNFYLQALSQNAPQQTFYSHQTTLSSFSNWLIDRGLENANIRPELAARFLESLLMKTEYTTSSIQGVLGTLSNYLCYTLHEDPELLRNAVLSFSRDRHKASGGELRQPVYPLRLVFLQRGEWSGIFRSQF